MQKIDNNFEIFRDYQKSSVVNLIPEIRHIVKIEREKHPIVYKTNKPAFEVPGSTVMQRCQNKIQPERYQNVKWNKREQKKTLIAAEVYQQLVISGLCKK